MTLEEIALEIQEKMPSCYCLSLIPCEYFDGKLLYLPCYTAVDLNNSEWYSLNLEKYGDELKIPCIYSKKYSVIGRNTRRKPLKSICSVCSVTPRNVTHIKPVVKISRNTSAEEFRETFNNIVKDINNKYNINILYI